MAENEIQVDRDFTFSINMAGLQAPTGKGVDLPEGYYKAVIDDMYVNPEKNAGRVIIKLKMQDAPFTGTIRTDGLGIPQDTEDKVRYYWRGLSESAGYSATDLDAGNLTLGPKAFVGKTVHIKYTPKEEGNKDREFENILYLNSVEWSQQKQAWDASAPQRQAQTAQRQAGAGSALGGSTGGGNALGAVQSRAGNTLGGSTPANGGGMPLGGGGDTVNKDAVLGKLGLA